MKSVLVTGASGFIGSYVLYSLLKRGYNVHAINLNKKCGIDTDGVIWHKLDLLDICSVDSIIKLLRPEGLIHLAWETKHQIYWNSDTNLDWVASSIHMLQKFYLNGGNRALIVGTSAEYQWGGAEDLSETKTPLVPSSLYGVSKNSLRQIIDKWASNSGLSWSWARLFNVYGPGEKSFRLIPNTINTLIAGNSILFDRGNIIRDFLYVEDAAEALVSLFQSDLQGPVNVASGYPLSIHELIVLISEYLGKEKLINFNAKSDDSTKPKRVVACVSRLQNELGWKSAVSNTMRLQDFCNLMEASKI